MNYVPAHCDRPGESDEGHAKITIHLDDAGQVSEARFHVTEFRGFEQFCVGRPLWEMPGLTSRICGICPVSHLLAAAKAADRILAVTIPPAAEKLRRLMNLGQIVQSHAFSFVHLSAPDLLLGMESDPAARNLFGLAAAEPELGIVKWQALAPNASNCWLGHTSDPQALLALAQALYGYAPPAWLLGVPAQGFELGAPISAVGRWGIETAARSIGELLQRSLPLISLQQDG
jgi:hypothetical protein